MKIGIIGPGNMGSGLGRLFARSGHEVMFSFSRDEERLRKLAEEIGEGAHFGEVSEAVRFGEVVLLTVPWGAVDTALAAAGSLEGKIVISCVNPLTPDYTALVVGTTTSGAEVIAGKIPGATVVEAFLNIFAGILHSGHMAFSENGGDIPSVFFCGDDARAKAMVSGLIKDIGLEPIDCGPLQNARFVEPTAMLVLQLGAVLGMGREWRPGEFTDLALKVMQR